MEQKKEPCAEVLAELVKINTKIEHLESQDEVQNKRLSAHGRELDELNSSFNDMKTDMALLKQTNENILDNTKDIKYDVKTFRNDLEKLSKNHTEEITNIKEVRDRDHLHEPKQKIDKYRDYLITMTLGAFLMYILYQIAPFLK